MTDSVGTVVWAADYKPFGEATITISTITNNLRFPGQYYDQETGLHYNFYRDYMPVIGRYIEADPIGIQEGTNHLFTYSKNNPNRFIDPFGLAIWICNRKAEGIVGAVGGNHAYLWDDRSGGKSCGMRSSSGSGDNSSANDKGPQGGDQCTKISGGDGKEDEIMRCCQQTANKGMWTPAINDCHEAADDCIKGAGLKNPGAPGGRTGPPCDPCKK